jgi:hypothetical protein
MPWALIVVAALLLLMSVPGVQIVLALLVAAASASVMAPVLWITEPIVVWLMRSGIRGGWVATLVFSVILAPFAAFSLYQCLRRDRTARQRMTSFNILVLVVGLPLIVAYAWWLLPEKFL